MNEPELVTDIFDRSLLEQLQEGDISRLSLKAEFLLEQYTVGVECDSPWARARVSEIRETATVTLAGNALPIEC